MRLQLTNAKLWESSGWKQRMEAAVECNAIPCVKRIWIFFMIFFMLRTAFMSPHWRREGMRIFLCSFRIFFLCKSVELWKSSLCNEFQLRAATENWSFNYVIIKSTQKRKKQWKWRRKLWCCFFYSRRRVNCKFIHPFFCDNKVFKRIMRGEKRQEKEEECFNFVIYVVSSIVFSSSVYTTAIGDVM